MADRCFAGELDWSTACKASRDHECVRLGIEESTIRYRVVRGAPSSATDRVAEHERPASETAAAEAASDAIKIIFA